MANGDPMPLCGVIRDDWRLNYVQSMNRSRNGGEIINALGEPYWTRQIEVAFGGATGDADFAAWEAFLIARQGRRFSFTAPRIFRRNPQAGVTDDSGLGVASIDRAVSTITLSGAGTRSATAGDMLSFYTANSGYWCGMATADANPSGGSITIPVQPAPFPPHASTAQPRRTNALGEFRLAEDFQLTDAHRRKSITLTAVQVIRG
ncbi:hypothetical protein [Euryhalocaulis caribicus]|uniref:hypothetical protein n=1 Tax=Euryhalocaulis caribicus TaxID=1161401 RepID=UPI0003A37458|nr:hypothetical protein [Euryhalocaulis caribicus]